MVILIQDYVFFFCSFDDSSFISSGDISDIINEISIDDGNLIGGSDQNNSYNSFKRISNVQGISNGYFGYMYGKRVFNFGISVFMGADYSSDVSFMFGWRKYSLFQINRLLSSDFVDYVYLFNGYIYVLFMQYWGQFLLVQG